MSGSGWGWRRLEPAGTLCAAIGTRPRLARTATPMIDIRKLKELVRLMVANELTEIDLRDSEEQVTLRRTGSGVVGPGGAPVGLTSAAVAAPAPAAAAGDAGGPGEPDDNLLPIDSPMVGTFYSAPDPDSAAFVSVGASVGPETVVCMMEAMKIFNEIKAGCTGSVHKILVKNGEPVEFGQTLFLVKPN